MSVIPDASVYTDFSGLADLKRQAREDSPEAIRAVARQFEAVFIQMMLKSMREASLGDSLLDGPDMDNYTSLYDQQLALEIAQGPGLGFSKTLFEQLGGQAGDIATDRPSGASAAEVLERIRTLNAKGNAPAVTTRPAVRMQAPDGVRAVFETPEDFVRTLLPDAREAARELGTKPEVLIAQAALETGWGRSVIRREDGGSSFNLFNIKADDRWPGERVTVDTLEYRDGIARREKASFRAYDSFADSFRDYVAFLRASPRYRPALEQARDPQAFIDALHKAGYATDPDYAGKVGRILKGEVIGSLKLSAGVPTT